MKWNKRKRDEYQNTKNNDEDFHLKRRRFRPGNIDS
jgi:hypothetical protein